MERIKGLFQIVNQPWFWFAVALACGVAAVLFSWTVVLQLLPLLPKTARMDQ